MNYPISIHLIGWNHSNQVRPHEGWRYCTPNHIYLTYDYENFAFKLWYDGSRTFYEKNKKNKEKKKRLEQNNK